MSIGVYLALLSMLFAGVNDVVFKSAYDLLVFNKLSAILVPYVAILGLVIRKYSTKIS